MREFESNETLSRPNEMLLRKTVDGDVIECTNCNSIVPTIYHEKRAGERCDRYSCEVCYCTHLATHMIYGTPATLEHLCKGVAWGINRILQEIRNK